MQPPRQVGPVGVAARARLRPQGRGRAEEIGVDLANRCDALKAGEQGALKAVSIPKRVRSEHCVTIEE